MSADEGLRAVIFNYLRRHISAPASEIADELGVSSGTIAQTLRHMKDENKPVGYKRGIWRYAPEMERDWDTPSREHLELMGDRRGLLDLTFSFPDTTAQPEDWYEKAKPLVLHINLGDSLLLIRRAFDQSWVTVDLVDSTMLDIGIPVNQPNQAYMPGEIDKLAIIYKDPISGLTMYATIEGLDRLYLGISDL